MEAVDNSRAARADGEIAELKRAMTSVDSAQSKADASVDTLAEGKSAAKLPWTKALVREVKGRPFGYTVLVLFVLAGPLVAPLLFPQASPTVAAVGGLVFGLYAALCAVPQKFL